MNVKTEDNLSRLQEFFLQPIIKYWSNIWCHDMVSLIMYTCLSSKVDRQSGMRTCKEAQACKKAYKYANKNVNNQPGRLAGKLKDQ